MKLRFHDLRHVHVTWQRDIGADIDTIRELSGHEDRSTTDGYITGKRLIHVDILERFPQIRKFGTI